MSFCPEGPFHKYWYFYRIFYLFVLIKHIHFPSVSQVWHCDQIFSCASILLKAHSIISDDLLFYVRNCIQIAEKGKQQFKANSQTADCFWKINHPQCTRTPFSGLLIMNWNCLKISIFFLYMNVNKMLFRT